MKITIAGAGYVGLVTAACLADKGHDVICVDVNEEKIQRLNEGIVPIYEPGLEPLIQRNSARLRFTTNDVEAYRWAEVIMIAVGTPPLPDGSVKLDDVWETLRRIAASVERDCLVAIKSTVPVGTGDEAARFVAENGRAGVRIDVVSNPEFLSQGTAVRDTLQAPRIVLGVESERAERVMKDVYAPLALPYVVTDRRSAEMIKYAANVFLALKISYINEIANVCELVGADIQAVAEGIGMDPRIGRRFLRAGVGYGGSCLPKDANALYSLAASHGYSLKTVWAAMDVNEKQKWKLFEKARAHLGVLSDRTAAVLGAAFKPGTDDVRESPALANIERLIAEGPLCVSGTRPLSNMSPAVLAMQLFAARDRGSHSRRGCLFHFHRMAGCAAIWPSPLQGADENPACGGWTELLRPEGGRSRRSDLRINRAAHSLGGAGKGGDG
ncbi:UDP-glucose 6-dehydrogenase YwqF [Geobacillus sp. BCO2]|nr:UDP-glucose 6-dehydrogenase YwqF [Geobacillus sp. BCO2]